MSHVDEGVTFAALFIRPVVPAFLPWPLLSGTTWFPIVTPTLLGCTPFPPPSADVPPPISLTVTCRGSVLHSSVGGNALLPDLPELNAGTVTERRHFVLPE